MDKHDRQILRLLQQSSTLPNHELAAAVGLSTSPCHRRVKALEDSGVVSDYRALVNRAAVGYGFLAFAMVTLDRQTSDCVAAFETAMLQREEVLEAHLVSGDFDFLLKVVAADMDDFQRFIMTFLAKLPEVTKIRTLLPMRSAKETTICPVRD